jgi:tetratricopeptide (TPR) repeat protein/DNA-binding CsgD family transcriptional regulator
MAQNLITPMNNKYFFKCFITLCCILQLVAIPFYSVCQPSYQQIDSFKAELEKATDDKDKVWLMTDISFAAYMSDFPTAIKYAEDALELSEKMGYEKGKYQCYQSIGRCYITQGNYPTAIKYFLKALDIAEKLQDNRRRGDALLSLANVYGSCLNYNKSIAYYKKAEEVYRLIGDDNTSMINSNITGLYITQNQAKKALQHGHIALKTNKSSRPSTLAHLHNNLGSAYILDDRLDKGLLHCHQALVYANKSGDVQRQASIEVNLGKAYALLYNRKAKGMPDSLKNISGFPALAETYAKSALKKATELGDTYIKMNSLRLLKDVQTMHKNYNEALNFYDNYVKERDSLYSQAQISTINKLEAEFAVRATTDSLNYANALLGKEVKIKRLQHNVMIILCILGITIALFLIFGQRQRYKTKMAAAEAQKRYTEKIARQQLEELTQRVYEKTTLLETMTAEVQKYMLANRQEKTVDYELINTIRKSVLLTDTQWEEFKHAFEKLHPGYLYRLSQKMPELTPAEIRFIVLSRLSLSNKEMAAMLGVSTDAMRVNKHRLMKKMNIQNSDYLDNVIQNT